MCLAGLILWWPGVVRWTRTLVVDFTRGWRRIVFDAHSAVGFWTVLDVRPERGTTAGDLLMVWLFPIHAGWFGGLTVEILWAALGLTFPVMFITGAMMWWNRVLSPAITPSARAYLVETTLPSQTDA